MAYSGVFPTDAPLPTLDSLVQEWEAAFADPGYRAFLAEAGDGPVGTVVVRADPEVPNGGQLPRLHVLPELWGRRIGSVPHDTAVAALREDGYSDAGLWVLQANARARAFYERRGWNLVPGKALEWPGLGTKEVR